MRALIVIAGLVGLIAVFVIAIYYPMETAGGWFILGVVTGVSGSIIGQAVAN